MLLLYVFLHQIFFSFCFYLQDFIKNVRLFLAALSISGLSNSMCLVQTGSISQTSSAPYLIARTDEMYADETYTGY